MNISLLIEVNYYKLALRSCVFWSIELNRSTTHILVVSYRLAIRTGLSLQIIHFLSYITRQLLSYNFLRNRSAGPLFVGYVYYVLFLFVIFRRLGSIPECIGYILAPLVKCIGEEFDIACLFISGAELLP